MTSGAMVSSLFRRVGFRVGDQHCRMFEIDPEPWWPYDSWNGEPYLIHCMKTFHRSITGCDRHLKFPHTDGSSETTSVPALPQPTLFRILTQKKDKMRATKQEQCETSVSQLRPWYLKE